jgi:tetratricopeptide (TPR) repeat protein
MNEELSKKRTKSWLYAWLIIFVVVMAILIPLALTADNNWAMGQKLVHAFPEMLLIGFVVATAVVGLWIFIRWLCCWKNFRRFLFVLACLLTLTVLGYTEENWRTKHALDKFESHWAAQGEKFDMNDIVPPAVPDDENFAMAPIWVESLKAILGPQKSRQFYGDNYAEDGRTDFVDRLSMPIAYEDEDGPALGNWQKATLTDLRPWQDYYRTVASKTNLFPVPPSPQNPAQDVLLALSKYDPAIEELRQASTLPDARFPVDYTFQPPAAILLPHLGMMRHVEKALSLRSLAELQNGQSDKALADLNLSFRLIDSARGEPFLISHLVRIAMWQPALQTIYEGLARHQWSDSQLVGIDSQLAKMDFLADYEYSISGEQALELANTEYLRRTSDFGMLDYSDNGSHNDQFRSFVFRLLPGAFFYQNELTMLQLNQECGLLLVDDQNHSVSPHLVQQKTAAESKALSHLSYGNVMARFILPSLDNAVKKTAYAQETVDLARIANALERYRLAMGVYPDSLDALAPHFLPGVPNDIIDAGPLHYRRTSDGQFILYSIGWNETDDGGTVSRGRNGAVNTDFGDWVWQYPSRTE